MADSKARNDTFRYTVFVLSAVALVSGLILNNGAILQDLMDNLSHSTLPGF